MLPDCFIEKQDAGMASFAQSKMMRIQIDEIKAKQANGEKPAAGAASNTTIFDSMLVSRLPDSERETERLTVNLWSVISETHPCGLVFLDRLYYKSLQLNRLVRESNRVRPDKTQIMSSVRFGCIWGAHFPHPSCRSFGVCTRLQRFCSDEVLTYDDGETQWKVPPNVPVCMSCSLIHLDPSIFPVPFEFAPERRLADPQHLSRDLCSFSKGSRQCVGINMAYAQLHLCVADIFRRCGGPSDPGALGYFELFDTTSDDVEIRHDLSVPFPKQGFKGAEGAP
ncbi:uncharacterized protein Z519_02327 [Cladophialophora bantiana CBS 173.52]|uniref:Cytochrome P450 n=1 Tax=Cladophialophora bantiana (strain ATCC 10958 / CBS 173.52 / CDC B-1940 / NIH 8579) TaxID=1442370 RepID=A0A0D2F3Z6_CLAB1|nr:uncharacterized protein Z519_02327 [Cladophialophora bantiana CBS 173.52]KIW96936.1 hypothetical protein Z519_02327 [Cladophialophora bantiana CBS 173.52]